MSESDVDRRVFLEDVLAGLSAEPKCLPGKYLWDESGSILFDHICDHPDYYPTWREMALLPGVAAEVACLVGSGATIVEYGSGASRKIRTLLDALDRPARYVAIDISREFLEKSVRQLATYYQQIAMHAVCADFSQPIRLPIDCDGPVLGFFPGTSIGNLMPNEAQALMKRARETLGPGSFFLVGVDPTQDEATIRRAYGDSGGLMPALHLNVLRRLCRELDAEIEEDAFRHEARILRNPFRTEPYLVASRANTWRLAGRSFAFESGDSVRTDVSHKYTPEVFRALVMRSGWTPERLWLDPDHTFSLHLLRG